MNIAFIGGGNMARAIISGMLTDCNTSYQISVCDPNQTVLDALVTDLKIRTSVKASTILVNADFVFLAVKPQIIQTVCEQISTHLPSGAVIVSIAAGIPVRALQAWLNTALPIVRTMPNTPALVRMGMTGVYCGVELNNDQASQIDTMLQSIGQTLWLDSESELDIVTAISGSGPAYFFLFFSAVQQAAKNMGFSEENARKLIEQTALGAAKMSMESSYSTDMLKQMVTSKGGVTEQALAAFSEANWTDGIISAVKAANKRSIELSKKLGG